VAESMRRLQHGALGCTRSGLVGLVGGQRFFFFFFLYTYPYPYPYPYPYTVGFSVILT